MTAASTERVVALVPCYDAADSVAVAVRALLADPHIDQVVVIDDASRDESALLAASAGARVVVLARNLGKGDAVAAGVAAAPDADVYLLVDSDTKESAAAAVHLLAPIRAGEADLVVGVLPSAGTQGGFGAVKRFAQWGVQRACGFEGEAPLSGQRAVRGPLLRSLVLARRFGLEVGMTIDAVRSGARVVEHPVEMHHRHRGRKLSGFVHRGRQGVDIAMALLPRLTPRKWRVTAMALLALVLLLGCVAVADRNQQAQGSPLPAAGDVRIVLVPGASWDDEELRFETETAAGSVVTGRVTDVIAVVQAGSRDPDATPSAEVEVETSFREPEVEPGEIVIVAGVTTTKQEMELRPMSILGAGVSGTLTSPSTHRSGLVDITDLAPTALTMMGKPVPESMTGSPVRVLSEPVSVDALTTANRFARFSTDLLPAVTSLYVVLQSLVYAAALAFARQNRWLPLGVLAAAVIAAFPAATYVMTLLFSGRQLGPWAWSAICAAGVGMIVAMSFRAARSPSEVLRRILLGTMLLLVADLLFGARMQLAGMFGSSPLMGARYTGIGNPSSVLLLLATVTWAGLHVNACQDRTAAIIRVGAVLVLITAVVGMPGLGSDIGGLISFTLTGSVLLVLLSARKLSWSLALFSSAVAACGVVIAGAIDYVRPAAERTHLGRTFAEVLNEGIGPLFDIAARKIEANIFGYAFPWSIGVVLLALALLYTLFRDDLWQPALPTGSVERSVAIAAIIGGLIAFAVNDSGIVVLALTPVFLGPFVLVQDRLHHVSDNQLEVVAP